MDFPKILETRQFVNGLEEKKQEMVILLRQSYGTILQDVTRGTDLSEHQSSAILMQRQVEMTLEVVRDVTNLLVYVEDELISVSFTYKSSQESLEYNVKQG